MASPVPENGGNGVKRAFAADDGPGELQQQEHTTLDDVLVPLASPPPDLKKQKLLDAELPDVDDNEQFPEDKRVAEEEDDEDAEGLDDEDGLEIPELNGNGNVANVSVEDVEIEVDELVPLQTMDANGDDDEADDEASGIAEDRDENDFDIVDVDGEDDASARDDENEESDEEEEDDEEDVDLSVGGTSSAQYQQQYAQPQNNTQNQQHQQQVYSEEDDEDDDEDEDPEVIARLRKQERNKQEARGLLNQLDDSVRSKLCLTALEKYGEDLFFGHEQARDAILVDACSQDSILSLMKDAIRVSELYSRGTSAAPLELDDDDDEEDDNDYESDDDTERGARTNDDDDEDDDDEEEEEDDDIVLISEEETDVTVPRAAGGENGVVEENEDDDDENIGEGAGDDNDDDDDDLLDADAAELAAAPALN